MPEEQQPAAEAERSEVQWTTLPKKNEPPVGALAALNA